MQWQRELICYGKWENEKLQTVLYCKYEYNVMTSVWRCPSVIINILLCYLQQCFLIFLLLSGILYMFSFQSFTGIIDNALTIVFPTTYKADDFLRRKASISAVVNCESGYFIISKIQLSLSPGYQDNLPPTWHCTSDEGGRVLHKGQSMFLLFCVIPDSYLIETMLYLFLLYQIPLYLILSKREKTR